MMIFKDMPWWHKKVHFIYIDTQVSPEKQGMFNEITKDCLEYLILRIECLEQNKERNKKSLEFGTHK